MSSPPTIPGTGFVSLADYLKANQGTLGNNFASLNSEAQSDVSGAQAGPGQAQTDAAMKSQGLGAQLGSESGLAGRYGGPGGQFDASLMWAQYGPQLQSLSQYLGSQQPKPIPQAPAPSAPPASPPGGTGPGQRPEPGKPRYAP